MLRTTVLMSAVVLAGCSSIGMSRQRGGLQIQEILGTQIGPSWAKVGDAERHRGVSAHVYAESNFTVNGTGLGLRGGFGGDSAATGDLRYGGYPIGGHLMVGTPPREWGGHSRLGAYAGFQYMFSGDLSSDATGTRSVGGYQVYLGGRLLLIPFNRRVTYSLFVELGNTASFDTDIGSFSSRALRFGSLFTF